MRSDHRVLVLVVDTDQRFIDDARPLLAAHRVLTARDLDEAREIVLGGRVDLVLLGPAFGSDVAVGQAGSLFAADSSLQIALAADVVTNRLLKAALKGGLNDVLDTPLGEADLAELIRGLPPSPRSLAEVELVVEPAAGMAHAAPATSSQVNPSNFAVESVLQPQPAPPASVEAPKSVATPAEITFVTEGAPQRVAAEAETMQRAVPPAPAAGPPAAELPASSTPFEQPQFTPHLEAVPSWPAETAGGANPPPAPTEVLPPERPTPAPAAPSDSEGAEPSHSGSMPVTDILDRVMPPPPPKAPPTAAPEAGTPVAAEAGTPVAPEAGESALAEGPSGPGRVIAVMAGKGGSGKSITATNLAIAIGLRTDPERVVIVDADLQFGDVALLLRLDPVRTLDDLVGRVEQMSDTRIDGALHRHESGIRVLPAPMQPVRAGEIDAKSVVEVIDRLSSMFDTVIVDTGSVFDDGFMTIIERADQIVTVVDMDLPSVKNAKIVLDGLRQVGFDMDRIRLVVNRVNSKAGLDLVELERSLGLRTAGSIPSDRLIPQSVNAGRPVLAQRPRSKVARSFLALAESLESNREHSDR